MNGRSISYEKRGISKCALIGPHLIPFLLVLSKGGRTPGVLLCWGQCDLCYHYHVCTTELRLQVTSSTLNKGAESNAAGQRYVMTPSTPWLLVTSVRIATISVHFFHQCV